MRGKISPAIKQKAVMEIESGRLSQSEVARRLCVDGETVRSWLTAYRSEGNAGLESGRKNRIYSVQTKAASSIIRIDTFEGYKEDLTLYCVAKK